MVRVTKKDGGVIAIRESDLRAWSFHPEAAGLQKFNDILCAVHTNLLVYLGKMEFWKSCDPYHVHNVKGQNKTLYERAF